MKSRLYLLIATEAVMSNPNNDPYNGAPRVLEDGSGRVFVTPESLRWHLRRALESLRHFQGEKYGFTKQAQAVPVGGTRLVKRFQDDEALTIGKSFNHVCSSFGVKDDTENLGKYCLDIPFMGVVFSNKKDKPAKAKKTDKAVEAPENPEAEASDDSDTSSYHQVGTIGHLSWLTAIHNTALIGVAVNNAFCQEGKTQAGSNSSLKVGYALMTALLEVDLTALCQAFKNSLLFTHAYGSLERKDALTRLLIDVVNTAYGEYAVSSKTQIGHRFLKSWNWQSNHYLPISVEQLPHNWFYTKLDNEDEVRSLSQIERVKETLFNNMDAYLAEIKG